MDCFSKWPEKHNEVMMLPSAVGAAPLWAPTCTSVSTDSPGSAVGGEQERPCGGWLECEGREEGKFAPSQTCCC